MPNANSPDAARTATLVEALSLTDRKLTVRLAGAERAVELDTDFGRPYFNADYALRQGADLDVVKALRAVDELVLQDAIDALDEDDRLGWALTRKPVVFGVQAVA